MGERDLLLHSFLFFSYCPGRKKWGRKRGNIRPCCSPEELGGVRGQNLILTLMGHYIPGLFSSRNKKVCSSLVRGNALRRLF